MAYAFNRSECFVWEGDLYGIRTNIAEDQKLHVKLASSALSDTGGKYVLCSDTPAPQPKSLN